MVLTINNILELNSTGKYVYLRTCLDNIANSYKPLFDTGYSNFINKYIDFLEKRLSLSLKSIGNFESLFDLQTSQDMILKLLNEKFQEFINKSVNSKLMMDSSWEDFANLGLSSQESQSNIGYSGYDVNNQEGNFSKSNTSGSAKGGAQRIQYIMFLNDTTNNFIDIFIKDVVKLICRIIY